MNSQSFRFLTALTVLIALSGPTLAGPNFNLIEQGRLAKKAETQKAALESKKCLTDSNTVAVTK